MLSDMKTSVCPVCGKAAPAADNSCSTCCRCRFPYAYIGGFGSKNAQAVWNSHIQQRKSDLFTQMQRLCREQNIFTLTRTKVAYLSPADRHLEVIADSRTPSRQNHVRQYSSAEDSAKNEVILRTNGTLLSHGDNIFGQNNTEAMTHIRKVVTTFDCTYAITENGDVLVSGLPVSDSVRNWHHVRELGIGNYRIAALTEQGKVLLAGNMITPALLREVEQWPSDVVSIASEGDALMALRANGTVLFAGDASDQRHRVRDWSQVTAIAIQSLYAIGLTADGHLLLASADNTPDSTDSEPNHPSRWEKVVAISACRSGIGALSSDGQVHLAGNIRRRDQLEAACRPLAAAIQEDLLRCAAEAL